MHPSQRRVVVAIHPAVVLMPVSGAGRGAGRRKDSVTRGLPCRSSRKENDRENNTSQLEGMSPRFIQDNDPK